MNRINITIDSESLAQLDRQAKEEGRTRSAHIRELIKKGKTNCIDGIADNKIIEFLNEN